jgi:tripartite-type tricarboxylate transporter receptor subunit TctC
MTFGADARAADYPAQPVTLMCGYAAGGVSDVTCRLLAEGMSEVGKQKVLVDNRPSAGAFQATSAVVNARPDGYTLLFSSNGQLTANRHTFAKPPVDANNSLRHICVVLEAPYVYVMNKDVPAANFAELIELAKKKPGDINYSTPSSGSSAHFTFALMTQLKGVDMRAVHYRGGQNQLTDLLANQVQLGMNTISTYESFIRSGQLKPLFVTSATRLPEYPDIPSAIDVGMPEYAELKFWTGLHAPLRTPDDVAAQIRDIAQRGMNTTIVKDRLKLLGMRYVESTPQSMLQRIEAESEVVARAVKAAGLTPQ